MLRPGVVSFEAAQFAQFLVLWLSVKINKQTDIIRIVNMALSENRVCIFLILLKQKKNKTKKK